MLLQEASNAERLAVEKKKLEEEAKKRAELEEEQRRIVAENASKKYVLFWFVFNSQLILVFRAFCHLTAVWI